MNRQHVHAMKKILPLTIFAASFLSLIAFAIAPGEEAPNYRFKSTDDELSFDVERGTGEVKMHLLVKDMAAYHHIIIERSAETPNYFGKCKYISCADQQTKGGYIQEADRFPYSPAKDVYYRVKTVSNDGVERAYPAILLAASK